MSKRRKKSSKCPEPFNTLIDLAAGLTMGAVANRMEKKYHYTEKGKVNPYAASAVGIASGRLKSTEGLLKMGVGLGAMGSFDVEADDKPYIPDDPLLHQIREPKKQDNRYAWRLNCADGSEYGISPLDYETREAYHAAIDQARAGGQDNNESSLSAKQNSPVGCATTDASGLYADNVPRAYIFCRVQLVDTSKIAYYKTEDQTLKVGSIVIVPEPCTMREVKGVVLSVEQHTRLSLPQPVGQLLEIIGRGE